MRLKLHPEAEEEIFQDAAWDDEQRAGLGDEFLQHVDRWVGVTPARPGLEQSSPTESRELRPRAREHAELRREIEGRPEYQELRERLLARIQQVRAGAA